MSTKRRDTKYFMTIDRTRKYYFNIAYRNTGKQN